MDRKRSLLNVVLGVFFKILFLIATLLSRRFLTRYIGNDANGVVSLFTSVIGILSIAELGVGTAISFSMYKPIVENDNVKVNALYNLYKKMYAIIGLIVLGAGLAITPFIPFMAKDYYLSENIYILFLIQLVCVFISYYYAANLSLINAYKNNYITTTVTTLAQIFKCLVQMLVLYLTKSFYFFLLSGLFQEFIQFAFFGFYTSKKYKPIIVGKNKLDELEKKEVNKNIKAVFFHKVGGLVVNSIDSLIISVVLGVSILGIYSNYIVLINAILTIVTMLFTQLVSVIGHSYYKVDKQKFKRYFMFFYFFNWFVASFVFLGFYACSSIFIENFFGEGLIFDNNIVLIITINYFIQFMEQTVRLFKDSTGLFYYDRYKCLIEAAINLILSIAFVFWLGVIGVIVATIITNLLICHIVEPLVLYKHVFEEKPTKYYVINYIFILIFVGLLFVYSSIWNIKYDNFMLQFFMNGIVGTSLSLVTATPLGYYYLKFIK